MKIAAGILIICNKQVLLVHSTNSSWWKSWMPPKGGIEENESLKEAASREVLEETGILIKPSLLSESFDVLYASKNTKPYKKAVIFTYKHDKDLLINYLDSDNSDYLKKHYLQLAEVDSAKFVDINELEKICHPKYFPFIEKILNEI